MNNLPKRKSLRLKNYDYSANGAYFVTICTHEKKCILSTVGAIHESPEKYCVKLNRYGSIVRHYIKKSEKRFSVIIPEYVIMPNHIHLLIVVDNYDPERAILESPLQSTRSQLSKIVGYIKMNTSKEIHQINPYIKLWQRGYYDHVVRNEEDYCLHLQYIEENPKKWLLGKDEYYA